jgi:hypothetical protein
MASCFGCVKMFSIAKEMSMTNILVNLMAFSPPVKPEYDISYEDKCNNEERGGCYKEVKFVPHDYHEVVFPWIETECYHLKKCSNKKKIVLLYIKNKSMLKNNNKSKVTLLFSHGNAVDLGGIYPFLVDLSTQLKVIFII